MSGNRAKLAVPQDADCLWLTPRQLYDVLPLEGKPYSKQIEVLITALASRSELVSLASIGRKPGGVCIVEEDTGLIRTIPGTSPVALRDIPGNIDEARALFDDIAESLKVRRAEIISEIHRAGADGIWIGFGRRGPEEDEETIESHYWDFLRIDFDARTASTENGPPLRFAGLRCLLARDLSSRDAPDVIEGPPRNVSTPALRAFLSGDDVRTMKRQPQKDAARLHFHPLHVVEWQFRKVFRDERRRPGPKPKS